MRLAKAGQNKDSH